VKKKKSQREDPETTPNPSTPKADRIIVFDRRFLEDLTYWVETDRKMALRLLSFVEEIRRSPFEGIGKPEPLKYQDANIWSRRLTQADRIVYIVTDDRIEFLQGRYHYGDR
jgi:toxin YoeB